MPAAARIGDMQTCTKTTGNVPHVGGPIVGPGASTVLVDGQPLAVNGSMAVCVASGPPSINSGSPTVQADGKEAARVGDSTDHDGTIIMGSATVLIGTPEQGATLTAAARAGAAFCRECQGGS